MILFFLNSIPIPIATLIAALPKLARLKERAGIIVPFVYYFFEPYYFIEDTAIPSLTFLILNIYCLGENQTRSKIVYKKIL